MKKSKFLTSILFIFFLGFASYGQTLNIPDHHGTTGALIPPVDFDPSDPPSQIKWTIVNNSTCNLTFNFCFTVDGVTKFMTFTVGPNDIKAITIGALTNLFPSNNIQFISNASFFVTNYGNSTKIGEGYENTNVNVKNTSITEGCDCIHIHWNKSNNSIIINNCF